MSEDNKNLNPDSGTESFLDRGIRFSLEDKPSEGFVTEMLKRISLEQEFAREDIQTSRIAKYILSGFISLIVFFVIVFSLFVGLNESNKDASFFSNLIDRFSEGVESISVLISENLGFTFDFQTAMILIVSMICIFLFSFTDRALFKKNFK